MMNKIVLIEDDCDLAKMIKSFLISEDFDVSWVDNGLDAVDLITQTKPDLVVLDIMLPGIDGVEVCRQIRAKDFDSPVLMLTAKDDDLSEVAALNTGADGYLNKPVRPHILLARDLCMKPHFPR